LERPWKNASDSPLRSDKGTLTTANHGRAQLASSTRLRPLLEPGQAWCCFITKHPHLFLRRRPGIDPRCKARTLNERFPMDAPQRRDQVTLCRALNESFPTHSPLRSDEGNVWKYRATAPHNPAAAPDSAHCLKKMKPGEFYLSKPLFPPQAISGNSSRRGTNMLLASFRKEEMLMDGQFQYLREVSKKNC
jgi:hypothetical protein